MVGSGYIQTEIGMIPNDWGVVPLPDVIWYQEGPGLRNWQFKNSGVKVINITNLQENGYLDLDRTRRYISLEEFDKMYRHFLIDEHDLVMASSGNSYCKTSIVRKNDLPLLMNTSVIRFKPLQGMHYSYMLVYLKSFYFKNQIDLLITGGAQPNFGPVHLKKIKIPLPPTIEEQTAIATVLSNADALIQSLEKLVDKKRAIKQGVMQELLKPKEGWEKKKLGNVLRIGHGRSQHEVVDAKGEYPILASGGIIGSANNYIYNKPSVLIGRKGTIDSPQYMDRPFWTIDTLFYTEIFEPNNAKYLFYQFCLIDWYQYNEASGVPSLSARTIENIEIITPKSTEQVRIANILTDMDDEISALESKLRKYKQIKQGMMQNLLTGRIRLV